MLSTQWDAIVIGAGPAGSLAARELAGQGLQVLLLDRAEFPRRKVCGCCLNGLALGTLNSVGLGQLVNEAGGVPLQQFRLAVQGRQSALPLPLGAALSREKFDLRLIEAAQQKGVTFVPKTKAQLGQLGKGFREVQTEAGTYRSKTVIVADGLNSQIANQEDNRTIIQAKSRIGGGTLIKDYPRFYEKGTIYMATGRQGYVGLVCLEDGRLDVAAAFDPVYVKQVGGLGGAAQQILARAGFPTINHLEDQNWKGTPPPDEKCLENCRGKVVCHWRCDGLCGTLYGGRNGLGIGIGRGGGSVSWWRMAFGKDGTMAKNPSAKDTFSARDL